MSGTPARDLGDRYAEPPSQGEATEELTSIIIQVPRQCRRFGARLVRDVHEAQAPARVRARLVRDRRQVDLRRRGRDQLRPLGHRSASPRLRLRPSRGRTPHRAARPPRRAARHPGRRREGPRRIRPRRRRRRARGVARGRHGRPRHRRHRLDAQRPPRGGVVGSRDDPPDGAASRDAHGRVAPVRARRRPGRDPGRAQPRRAAHPRVGRGRRGAGIPRRARRRHARPPRPRCASRVCASSRATRAIGLDFAEEALRRLGFASERKGKRLSVQIPLFRADARREDDLVEEVLRVWGYDRLPARLPPATVPGSLREPLRAVEERLTDRAAAAGFFETVELPVRRPRLGRGRRGRSGSARPERRRSRSASRTRSTRPGVTCARRCCPACSTPCPATCATAPTASRCSRSAAPSAPRENPDRPESLESRRIAFATAGETTRPLEHARAAARGGLLRREGARRTARRALDRPRGPRLAAAACRGVRRRGPPRRSTRPAGPCSASWDCSPRRSAAAAT